MDSTFAPEKETQENMPEFANFSTYLNDRWAEVLFNKDKKVIICRLKEAYTPIENFKQTFNRIKELAEEKSFEKFIFDKRALRAFHQPSMEWYFIYWKRDVLELGIKRHRKILPDEPWFEKMVQIAKDQILTKYPDHVIYELDILYCNSIEEALNI